MSSAQPRSSGKPSSSRASRRSATPAWQLPMPRSAAASSMAIVAWPRSSWARPNSLSASGPITTIVAAEPATWPAPRQTLASSRSCPRSVTTMKSHGCQFCEDGDRRPASRIWSRSAGGIGRSAKDRTLRREVIASQVCMPVSTPAPPHSFSAARLGSLRGCERRAGRLAPPATQEPSGPLAGPGQRTGGMAQRLEYESGDPGFDGRQDLDRGRPGRGPVADHRARVAHEVGQRHDAASAQHVGSRLRVRGIRGGRDDPDTRWQRPRGVGADRSRPGPGNQDVGVHLGEEPVRRHDRQAVAQHARIAVRAAQYEQPLDVQPRPGRNAPGHGGYRDHPAAAADHLVRHPAAHLAEPLDGHRTAVPAPARPSAVSRSAVSRGGPQGVKRRPGRRRDAVAGQHVLERHACHDRAHRRRRGPALPQRREILLASAHVRPGQEPARVGQRPDLGAEPGHQGGLARAVRRIPAYSRLGTADPLTQRGELVGHRPRQHRHLSHADIRRQPRPPGGQRHPGQVEHHKPRHRAELDDLRAITLRDITPNRIHPSTLNPALPPPAPPGNRADGISVRFQPDRRHIDPIGPEEDDGAGPPERDGRSRVPLAPQFRAILDTLDSAGLLPLVRGDAAQTRAHYRALAQSRRGPQFVPEQVASVADLRSPGGVPVRVFEPRRPGGSTLVYLHGGGWVVGDVETHDPLCRRVANVTGARVVSVDYRLAPEYPFPAALDDAEEVLRWLRAGEPDRAVGVAGDSAGASLAAGLAIRARDRQIPLAAQLLLYPATDPAMTSASIAGNGEGYFLTRHDMAWFYQQYLPDGAASATEADLARADVSGVAE